MKETGKRSQRWLETPEEVQSEHPPFRERGQEFLREVSRMMGDEFKLAVKIGEMSVVDEDGNPEKPVPAIGLADGCCV